jgi:hypothetical protein
VPKRGGAIAAANPKNRATVIPLTLGFPSFEFSSLHFRVSTFGFPTGVVVY